MVKCDYILILYLCSNHSQQHVQQCLVTRPTAQNQFQFEAKFFLVFLSFGLRLQRNGILGNLF